jgi:hypothetical protein
MIGDPLLLAGSSSLFGDAGLYRAWRQLCWADERPAARVAVERRWDVRVTRSRNLLLMGTFKWSWVEGLV